jgi:hypothetical protein
VFVAAGCDSDGAAPRAFRTAGPVGIIRVGLTDFRWPVDPVLASGRDETTLARALYSTPLRIDAVTGVPRPGLCRDWKADADFRTWTFTCRAAPSIAGALRRVRGTRAAPLNWLFADAEIRAPDATRLIIRLPFASRRFPYTLTSVAAAPRSVPGPFRLASGSADRVVVQRPGLTVEFRRLGARSAVREFRRGKLDEAPVPLGQIVALRTELGDVVRARTLLGLDLVVFRGVAARVLRRVYWQTADRGDYEELVPELEGSSAFGLVGSGEERDPAEFRRAVKAIASLPRVEVWIGVPADPVLRFGARLLYAQWRDVGLGPRLVTEPARADASFQRVFAAYPQEEAIPAQLVLDEDVGRRALLLRALAATQQHSLLSQLDEEFRESAAVVPVAWVVDARLVSPRLSGWREDVLGNVDYTAVRSRASSRRP